MWLRLARLAVQLFREILRWKVGIWDFEVCCGGCIQACSAFGYAVEVERCKAELRINGTRCPTCDRRCKVVFGIFGCVVAVAVRFVRHSAMLLRLNGARLN